MDSAESYRKMAAIYLWALVFCFPITCRSPSVTLLPCILYFLPCFLIAFSMGLHKDSMFAFGGWDGVSYNNDLYQYRIRKTIFIWIRWNLCISILIFCLLYWLVVSLFSFFICLLFSFVLFSYGFLASPRRQSHPCHWISKGIKSWIRLNCVKIPKAMFGSASMVYNDALYIIAGGSVPMKDVQPASPRQTTGPGASTIVAEFCFGF